MQFFKRHGLKIIGFSLVLIVVFFLSPWGGAFYQTVLLVPEFLPNGHPRPLQTFSQKPKIDEVQFQSGEKTIHADLWLPKNGKKYPAALLHLGIDIDRKDQRVQKVADESSLSIKN